MLRRFLVSGLRLGGVSPRGRGRDGTPPLQHLPPRQLGQAAVPHDGLGIPGGHVGESRGLCPCCVPHTAAIVNCPPFRAAFLRRSFPCLPLPPPMSCGLRRGLKLHPIPPCASPRGSLRWRRYDHHGSDVVQYHDGTSISLEHPIHFIPPSAIGTDSMKRISIRSPVCF